MVKVKELTLEPVVLSGSIQSIFNPVSLEKMPGDRNRDLHSDLAEVNEFTVDE